MLYCFCNLWEIEIITFITCIKWIIYYGSLYNFKNNSFGLKNAGGIIITTIITCLYRACCVIANVCGLTDCNWITTEPN